MITDNRWKYIWNNGDINELFDLSVDPGETNNLAGKQLFTKVQSEYRDALGTWMRDTRDPLAEVYD